MKKVIATLVVLVCLWSCIIPATAESEEFIIGFDMNSNGYEYCQLLASYVEEFARAAGFTPIITQSNADPATQISNVENMLIQGAKVVSLVTANQFSCVPIAEICAEAGVPCISVLTTIENEGNGYPGYIFLGSENFDGGYMQGEFLASKLTDKSTLNKVYFLGSLAADQQGIDRQAGFEAALKDLGVNYEIAAFEYTDSLMDKGLSVMENWLQVYDDIGIVVSTADMPILGAITAYEANGGNLDDVIWIGLDGTDEGIKSISEGRLDMTVLQDAKGQAEGLVETYKQIRDGVDPATIEDVKIPFVAITAENCADFM